MSAEPMNNAGTDAEPGAGRHHPGGAPVPVLEATPDTFDTLVLAPTNELVVVEFWGPDCPNCDAFELVRPELLGVLAGAPMRLVTVDAYRYPELARRFGLFGIPTFLLFRDGVRLGKMSQFNGRSFWLGVIKDHLPTG